MPTRDWNNQVWSGDYDWKDKGEEWSTVWGGSEAHWYGSLFPRLHRFLPADRVLEIAPGFGRWSKFLIPTSTDYFGIDLSAECVAGCSKIFERFDHAKFFQNDGLSLAAAPNDHFDLIFSYDSLVHAEMEVIRTYVGQSLGKLAVDGVAFFHHSNLSAVRDSVGTAYSHHRSESVSAELVADAVQAARGKVLLQEVINWGDTDVLLDGFTLFARAEAPWTPHPSAIKNANYMQEANNIRLNQSPWCVAR